MSIAKRKGANAITVANRILGQIENIKGSIIPDDIHVAITRNYGETAKEKANELIFHMFLAVFSVSLLIWITLGRREAGEVASLFLFRMTVRVLYFLDKRWEFSHRRSS